MIKTVQKRSLVTRAKLIEAATAVVNERGYEALRVEEVVLRAGVAKGTFFAHFADKDALMELLIGAQIETFLDAMEAMAPPLDVAALVEAMLPLADFMTCERYVFDVIMRHAGAADAEQVGLISMTFTRHGMIYGRWLEQGAFRRDLDARLLSEGILAFALQGMALKFCALHRDQNLRDRLFTYLTAWLSPPTVSAA